MVRAGIHTANWEGGKEEFGGGPEMEVGQGRGGGGSVGEGGPAPHTGGMVPHIGVVQGCS